MPTTTISQHSGFRPTRRQLLVGSSALLLASCTPYTYDTATKPNVLTPEVMAARINEVRKANGRLPVTYNATLARAAQTHANLMATKATLSHELGGTLRERVRAAGYEGAVGENLAGGHATLEAAIEGWLASPGHRSTLLSENWTDFGLAFAKAGSGRYPTYWALIMGGSFDAWRVYL